MQEFERELREALKRCPAPSGLKRKLMERRHRPGQWLAFPLFAWRGLAASLVSVSLCILAALALYGDYEWRQVEQRREAEIASQQVMAALRITGHALNHMNRQLAAHRRASWK